MGTLNARLMEEARTGHLIPWLKGAGTDLWPPGTALGALQC